MSEKEKLSKDVREQIQGLASGVYIQIEEKLTQLICEASSTNTSNSSKIEQEFKVKENRILEANAKLIDSNVMLKKDETKLTEQISLLEQKNSTLKHQLIDEQGKLAMLEQNFQVELTQNNINFTETNEQLIYENSRLKSELSEEQNKLTIKHDSLESETNEQITSLTKAIENLQQQGREQKEKIAQYQQNLSKKNQEYQKQLLTSQEQLVFLENQVKQQVKIAQGYKQEVIQQNDKLTKLKQQTVEDKKSLHLQLTQQQQIESLSEQQLAKLETKNKELADSLITGQTEIKVYQKEASSLKSQVKLAQDNHENILNRFNRHREKQEKDNNQVRETIKYLRDENNDMITVHNNKKKEFLEQIDDIESKLTEYRLKFEYAQKQLTKNN